MDVEPGTPSKKRGRKARPIVFVAPSPREDPGAPTPEEIYATTTGTRRRRTHVDIEDLKFEKKTKIMEFTLTTMEKLDRRKALEARVPAMPGKGMAAARRNILSGLELIDAVEQTRIIDDIMGYVALAEQSIFQEMKTLVDQGCNVETLTGNAMRLPREGERYLGPEDPIKASIIFHEECSELSQIHAMWIRLKELEARAETQASRWGNAVKNFRKKVDFEDKTSQGFFLRIGSWVESQEVKGMEKKMKALREKAEQEEIEELEQRIAVLEEKEELDTIEEEELEDLREDLEALLKKKRAGKHRTTTKKTRRRR